MPTGLRLWLGVLATMSFITAILLANVFPYSWVALWPGAFSLLCLIFLFLELGRVIRSRHQEALEDYTSAVSLRLDELSAQLEEVRQSAAQLEWGMKQISTLAVRRPKESTQPRLSI